MSRITDGIYSLESTGFAHVFLIHRESSILIDTGLPHKSRAILKEIAALGVDPRTIGNILLTHHDIDHAGNVNALRAATGADVWIGREDAPYLTGGQPRPGRKRHLARLTGVRPAADCHTYEERSNFDGIRAIPTPGHTPGHHLLQVGPVVFVGDLFRATGGGFLPMNSAMNSDPAALRRSLLQLAQMDFDIACPSHGLPVRRTEALDTFLKLEGSRS